MAKLYLKDPLMWDIFCEGNTVGVFQFESYHAQKVLKEVKPRCVERLSDVNAVLRPGAKDSGEMERYIARCKGDEPVTYVHDALEPVLNQTYGILLYQEQQLRAAQVLAGWSLEQADILRDCIGKKKEKELHSLKPSFYSDCAKNGITVEQADAVWAVFAAAARYSFNKSHSINYSVVGCQGAWVKANEPECFYAAHGNVDCTEQNKSEEFGKYYYDAVANGVRFCVPPIHIAGEYMSRKDAHDIYIGLANLKGVNSSQAESIIKTAKENENFVDFVVRSQYNGADKTSMEALCSVGFFDNFFRASSSAEVASNRQYMLDLMSQLRGITPARRKEFCEGGWASLQAYIDSLAAVKRSAGSASKISDRLVVERRRVPDVRLWMWEVRYLGACLSNISFLPEGCVGVLFDKYVYKGKDGLRQVAVVATNRQVKRYTVRGDFDKLKEFEPVFGSVNKYNTLTI